MLAYPALITKDNGFTKATGQFKRYIIIVIFVDTPLCLIKVLSISRRNFLVIKTTSKSDRRTFKNKWKAILIAPVYAQFSFEKTNDSPLSADDGD